MPQTRRDTSVFLIGNYQPQIIGGKLPSNGDVLRVLFYNMREVGLHNFRDSAKLVIEEVMTFWNKARIPTKHFWDSVNKLETLYERLRKLQKSKHKPSQKVQDDQKEFLGQLDNLFDISHENAIDLIKIKDDKDFLKAQQKPGREGFMHGVDWELCRKEERAEQRKKKQAERGQRHQENFLAVGTSSAGK